MTGEITIQAPLSLRTDRMLPLKKGKFLASAVVILCVWCLGAAGDLLTDGGATWGEVDRAAQGTVILAGSPPFLTPFPLVNQQQQRSIPRTFQTPRVASTTLLLCVGRSRPQERARCRELEALAAALRERH